MIFPVRRRPSSQHHVLLISFVLCADAAAASSIMAEIVRVAKDERLIILCTIHQPSTKVYQSFDELMLLSRGRLAFAGDVNNAVPYFESIGFPCPPATNPAGTHRSVFCVCALRLSAVFPEKSNNFFFLSFLRQNSFWTWSIRISPTKLPSPTSSIPGKKNAPTRDRRTTRRKVLAKMTDRKELPR